MKFEAGQYYECKKIKRLLSNRGNILFYDGEFLIIGKTQLNEGDVLSAKILPYLDHINDDVTKDRYNVLILASSLAESINSGHFAYRGDLPHSHEFSLV